MNVYEFLESIEGSVSLFFHNDCDGVSSGALMLTYLKTKGITPELHCGSIDKNVFEKYARHVSDNNIFLDYPIDNYPEYLEPFKEKKVLVIDHHPIIHDLNKKGFIHINPRFKDPKIYKSASQVTYEILEKMGLKGFDWLMRLGAVGDHAIEGTDEENEAADVVSAVESIRKCKGMITLAEFLSTCKHLKDFMYKDSYQKMKNTIDKELDKQVAKFDCTVHGDPSFFEVRSRYGITSKLSSKLFDMYPKKTLILYTKSGSIWKISGRSRKHDVNELFKKAAKDIGTGGGHCIHPDTLIMRKDGKIDTIANVKKGDRIESVEFDSIKNSNATCLEKFENIKKPYAYEMKTEYGGHLVTSPEHRLFSLATSNKTISIVERKMKDLKIGDYIASVKKVEPKTNIQKTPSVTDIIKRAKIVGHKWKIVKIPKYICPELSQIVGYVIGDGHIENNDIIEIRDERLSVLKEYTKIIRKIFKCDSKVSKIKNKNCWRIRIYSSTLAALFTRIIKNIELIEMSPNDVVGGFIRGLFDAEGTTTKREIKISMRNEQLICKIRLLLLRFGIIASSTISKDKFGVNHVLSINGENLEKFRDVIGLTAKDKMNNVKCYSHKVTQLIPMTWGTLKEHIEKEQGICINCRREYSRMISRNSLDKMKALK